MDASPRFVLQIPARSRVRFVPPVCPKSAPWRVRDGDEVSSPTESAQNLALLIQQRAHSLGSGS